MKKEDIEFVRGDSKSMEFAYHDPKILLAEIKHSRYIMRETLTRRTEGHFELDHLVPDPDPELTESIGDKFHCTLIIEREERDEKI